MDLRRLVKLVKNILLYPWGDYYLDNKIFYNENFYNLCRVEKNPLLILKERFHSLGYNFETIDKLNPEESDYIIFFELPSKINPYYKECIKKGLNNRMILFLWEPPIVNPGNYDKLTHESFTYIFTWMDDLVDNKKYFKFYYPQPSYIPKIDKMQFENKKLCTLISGNKKSKINGELYSERINAIKFFEKNDLDNFDLFGRGWNEPITKVEEMFPFTVKKFKSYRGETTNKLLTLSQYKFCICYENQSINGYITEKIFDCFFAGCIPIYLGASNISNYIPECCYIDKRNFTSYDKLYDYLLSIDKSIYENYENSIKKYLESNNFRCFTDKYFADEIASIIANFR